MGGMVLLLLGQSIGKMILKLNIEALVIFKKIQFAQGYEFYNGAKKKMNGSGKSEQERFTLQSCKSTARKCTRKCAAIRPIVVFHSSGQGLPTTVFCEISVRRKKFCLEFSFTWLRLSR